MKEDPDNKKARLHPADYGGRRWAQLGSGTTVKKCSGGAF